MNDSTSNEQEKPKSAATLAAEFLERSEFRASNRRLFIAGALLGVCIVFLSSMLGLPHLDTWDTPLKFALFAFAVAIPCLSVDVVLATYEFKTPEEGTLHEFALDAVLMTSLVADKIGGAAAYVGIAAIVWHFTGAALIVSIAMIAVLFATLLLTGVVLLIVRMWRAAKARGA